MADKQDIRDAARQVLGNGYEILTLTGKINIVQSAKELPMSVKLAAYQNISSASRKPSVRPLFAMSESGEFAGVYQDGCIHLVADSLKPESAKDVMLREGMHMLIQEDPFFVKRRTSLLNQFQELKDSSKQVRDAYAAVPKSTPRQYVSEEAFTYFLQHSNSSRHSIAQRMASTVKAWCYRHEIPTTRLNERDLLSIANQGLRSFSRLRYTLVRLTHCMAIKNDTGANLVNINSYASFSPVRLLPEAINALHGNPIFRNEIAAGLRDKESLVCAKAIIEAAGYGKLVHLDAGSGSPVHFGAKIDGTIHDLNGTYATPDEWNRETSQGLHFGDLNYSIYAVPGCNSQEVEEMSSAVSALIKQQMLGQILNVGHDPDLQAPSETQDIVEDCPSPGF